MSDVLKWLQNMANEEWEYEDGDYALEAIKFFNSLRAENEKLREENDAWQMDGASCANEVKYLRAENKRLREALKPFAKAIKGQIADILFGDMPDNSSATVILQLGDLRRARAALEGVTEKSSPKAAKQ